MAYREGRASVVPDKLRARGGTAIADVKAAGC